MLVQAEAAAEGIIGALDAEDPLALRIELPCGDEFVYVPARDEIGIQLDEGLGPEAA